MNNPFNAGTATVQLVNVSLVAVLMWRPHYGAFFRHQGDMSAFIQQSDKYFDFIQDALPISDCDDSSEEDDNTYSLEQ